jgi:hypothetical protein
MSVPLVTSWSSNEGGIAMLNQHTLQSRKRLGSGQAYTEAKRIVSPIYTFIEGREENFLLVPLKSEEVGFPISSNNNTISEAVQIARLPTNAHLSSYSTCGIDYSVRCALLEIVVRPNNIARLLQCWKHRKLRFEVVTVSGL